VGGEVGKPAAHAVDDPLRRGAKSESGIVHVTIWPP
jgi:hypothetical protein